MHDWFSKTGQGVGSEYRYNFGGGSDGDVRGLSAQRARDHRTVCNRRPDAELRAQRIGESAAAGQAARARARRLLLRASRRIRRSTRTSTNASQQPAQLRRQRRRRVAHLLAERHVRSHRVLLQPDQLRRDRKLAAHQRHAERTARFGDTPFYFSASGEYAQHPERPKPDSPARNSIRA